MDIAQLEQALESYPARLQQVYERLALARMKRPEYELLKVDYEYTRAMLELQIRTNPPDGIKITEGTVEALVKSNADLHQMAKDLAEMEFARKVPPPEDMQAEIALKVLQAELETLKLLTALSLNE